MLSTSLLLLAAAPFNSSSVPTEAADTCRKVVFSVKGSGRLWHACAAGPCMPKIMAGGNSGNGSLRYAVKETRATMTHAGAGHVGTSVRTEQEGHMSKQNRAILPVFGHDFSAALGRA